MHASLQQSRHLSAASRPSCSYRAPQSAMVCRSRPLCRASAGVPAAAAAGAAVADDKYAIIDVGGLRQFVEEGRWFAVKRDELQVESGSGRVQFDKVVAFKRDGEYFRGRPYLEDVVVEAQLVEEFTAGASVDVVQPMLGKVLVTRIAHTEATRRALEEAFSHSV